MLSRIPHPLLNPGSGQYNISMAKIYLEKLRGLIERLPLNRRERDDVTCKHFFSGAAAYVDGRIFMTLTPKGLALKLPEVVVRGVA